MTLRPSLGGWRGPCKGVQKQGRQRFGWQGRAQLKGGSSTVALPLISCCVLCFAGISYGAMSRPV